MADYDYFKMPGRKSWHLLAEVAPDYVKARCGRKHAHPVEALTVLPTNEKTCERCFVFAARDNDSA